MFTRKRNKFSPMIDGLERRLCLDGTGVEEPPADGGATDPPPAIEDPAPPDGDGTPPDIEPVIPVGPSDPA